MYSLEEEQGGARKGKDNVVTRAADVFASGHATRRRGLADSAKGDELSGGRSALEGGDGDRRLVRVGVAAAGPRGLPAERPAARVLAIAERALGLSAGVTADEAILHRGFHLQLARATGQKDAGLRGRGEGLRRSTATCAGSLLDAARAGPGLPAAEHNDAERVVVHAASGATSIPGVCHRCRQGAVAVRRSAASAGDNRARTQLLEEAGARSETLLVDSLEWLRVSGSACRVARRRSRPRRRWQLGERKNDGEPTKALLWLLRLFAAYTGTGRYGDARRVADRLPADRRGTVIDSLAFQHGRLGELRHVLESKRLDFDLFRDRSRC